MIILNERTYIEKIIADDTTDENPYVTLFLLAKYYIHHMKYSKNKTTAMIKDYMKRHSDVFTLKKGRWDEIAGNTVSKAIKNPLMEIDGVWITEGETEKIRELHDDRSERIAFTLLCLAKLGNLRNPKNNGWVNTPIKDVFRLARVDARVRERDYMIGFLADNGYLELPKRNDNISVRVTFADDGFGDSKLVCVDDFRELGYWYMKCRGENIVRCRECGILMKGNRNGTKMYCDDCAGYKPVGAKTVECRDCGILFEVAAKNTKSIRCPSCQRAANAKRKLAWKTKDGNTISAQAAW